MERGMPKSGRALPRMMLSLANVLRGPVVVPRDSHPSSLRIYEPSIFGGMSLFTERTWMLHPRDGSYTVPSGKRRDDASFDMPRV